MKHVRDMNDKELVRECNLPRHNTSTIRAAQEAFNELSARGKTPVIVRRDEEGAAVYALPKGGAVRERRRRINIFCAGCGKPLPQSTIRERHYTRADLERPTYCDRACRTLRDKQTGHYARMAASRGEGWLASLRASNRQNPRRKRKE